MSENTPKTGTVEAPETVAKKRQLSATFTPEEIKLIDDASWTGRHRKLSDFIRAAALNYANELLTRQK